MNKYPSLVVVISLLLTLASPTRAADPAPVPAYAVIVSNATFADPAWQGVVQALLTKHHAILLRHDNNLSQIRDPLARLLPRYACFVARPQEAGRAFVIQVHQLTRTLNPDPYTDVLWGILTAYSPQDALTIVAESKPLLIRKGLAGTGLDLSRFDSGMWFSEGEPGAWSRKLPGGAVEKLTGSTDSTAAIVDAFNTFQPDLFLTSGHATENDWQIGYSYRNGQFRCKDGQLFGLDLKQKSHPINSPNPKVYLPVGNCLMGHVADQQSMALAFMSSAGVRQMVGYVVSTWYGYAGWGVNEYFLSQPSRFNLAESFFLNQQALLARIESEFPAVSRLEFPAGNEDQFMNAIGRAAQRKLKARPSKDCLGLLWDRDTLAFYGDPAWDARLAPQKQELPWTQSLTESAGLFTFTLHASEKIDLARPPAALLPRPLPHTTLLQGQDLHPIIGQQFILLPTLKTLEKDHTYQVIFKADAASATTAPAQAAAPPPSPPTGYLLLATDYSSPSSLPTRALQFLKDNLPAPDQSTLSDDFLREHVKLACQTRLQTPWGKTIPEEIFLSAVLPYANLNESRDEWRADFAQRFAPLVQSCKTTSEAALVLNREIFKQLNVSYHPTKRPRPNQSPAESIRAGYASCTGLSILLIDACRAVGVPARIVGTPAWTIPKGDSSGNHAGNHCWVEIWDSQWHCLGASEVSPLDQTWFLDNASRADPSRPENRIYAASFLKTNTPFLLVWAPHLQDIPAHDVTRYYSARALVTLQFLDQPDGKPLPAHLSLRQAGQLIADLDLPNPTPLRLAATLPYDATLTTSSAPPITRSFTLSSPGPSSITLFSLPPK